MWHYHTHGKKLYVHYTPKAVRKKVRRVRLFMSCVNRHFSILHCSQPLLLIFLGHVWLELTYTNRDLTYTTRQDSRFSCLAQTGFAAFGKGVQLISWSPYAETEQINFAKW